MSKPTDLLSTPKPAQCSFDNSNFTTPTKRAIEQQREQHRKQPEQFDGTYPSTTAQASAVASGQYPGDSQAPVQAYAKLEGPDFCYYVRTLEVSLGRHPSADHHEPIDIDLGNSKAVSRRHAKIHYNFMNQSFELQVFGKNGCLVDDEYYAKGQSVTLRHKMVIQIGDSEFSFLLPKSAVPSAAVAAASLDANGFAPPPGVHGSMVPGHPPFDAALQPPHPQHAAYPVNAITPQRLNLYSAPEPAAGREPYRGQQQQQQQQQHGYPPYGGRAAPQYSPNHSPRSIYYDQEPPAPLSFGEARHDSHPPPPPASGLAYAADNAENQRRTDSYSPHETAPRHAHQRVIMDGAPGGRSEIPVQPLNTAGGGGGSGGGYQQGRQLAPSQQLPLQQSSSDRHGIPPGAMKAGARAPAAAGSYGAASEVRILPATDKPAQGAHQSRSGNYAKPTYSYASLIAQAINDTSEKKVTLNGIYTYIMANYPYYKHAQNGWQNSIRHNLSLNKAFIRVQRASNEPGKGSYWAIDDAYKGQFANGVYKRTRRTKKAMEIEREREKEKSQYHEDDAETHQRQPKSKQKKAAASANSTSPKRYTRSVAGEKRSSPDDDDDDGYDGNGYDYDNSGDGNPENGGDYVSHRRSGRHPAKRTSAGAMSTGEDTVDYMSSAVSNNGESNVDSLPDSPRSHASEMDHSTQSHMSPTSADSGAPPQPSSPSAQEPQPAKGKRQANGGGSSKTPVANGTRSKSGLSKQEASDTYAAPKSPTLPPSSRPTQLRPQKSAAH
ncbi:hypothetical protein IW140_003128 [Coemansia sp. RSA 1813]|nr:hypothetical protein EV178_003034 [Coemansia sp. RSA 1646]KAJ2214542.1 hypothetical protein EV179_002947 [Coemansia sp. RSA 487]KAJ2569425.1 hypothetical protein IW140_003128 [Coemansia sp. RSA 1813]